MASKAKTVTVEHSKRFKTVKGWYDAYGYNLIARIRLAVTKGWITEDEYKEITGENFSGLLSDSPRP